MCVAHRAWRPFGPGVPLLLCRGPIYSRELNHPRLGASRTIHSWLQFSSAANAARPSLPLNKAEHLWWCLRWWFPFPVWLVTLGFWLFLVCPSHVCSVFFFTWCPPFEIHSSPCRHFPPGVSADCGDKTPALSITAPTEMEALSGSCLLIPCNFRDKEGTQFDSSRDIYGVWIKSDSHFSDKEHNVIFNSSWSVNSYKMKITGNLGEQNCTTLFSDLDKSKTNKYFFRIESKYFRATAVCDPLQITVRDSPWSPTINISGEVKEKKSVTISCSAFTPCPHSPPQLTWNLQQNSHSQIEENTDGTFTSKIQQSITLSDSHDGFNISCSATYPVDGGKPGETKETQQTLSVPYAPKETSASISPSGLVSAGSWVNLTCSSRANPPISNFSWFLKTEDGPMKVAEGQFYIVNMTNMTGSYYCEATNILGNQRSSWIHVKSEGTESFPLPTILSVTVNLVIVLIFLLLCVCCLKRKNPTHQQTQNQTGEEEEIHYGDIKFSDGRPAPSSVSEQDSGQQQETVYARIQVSKAESSSEQTAEGLQDLYAKVNKK